MNEIDPIEQKRLSNINRNFAIIAVLAVAGSFWLGGVDFGLGCLLGSAVVAINHYLTKRLVAKIIFDDGSKGLALAFFVLKLALALLVVVIAVVKLKADIGGVFIGLSTIVVAMLLSALEPKVDAQEKNNP